jgi:hypothetical protein
VGFVLDASFALVQMNFVVGHMSSVAGFVSTVMNLGFLKIKEFMTS